MKDIVRGLVRYFS